MFNTPTAVHNWLAEKTGSRTFYLLLLDNGPRDEVAKLLPTIQELARLMVPYPDTTRLLLKAGWREALIGNMIAILQKTPRFEVEQALEIINGSWVAPQLAAGFALTTQGESIPLLEAFLELAIQDQYRDHAKPMTSTYAALKLLGSKKADAFERTSTYAELRALDRDECVERTYDYFHWDLWRSPSE